MGGELDARDPGEQGGERAVAGNGDLGSGVSVTRISGLGDRDLGGLDGTTSTTWEPRLLLSMLIMFVFVKAHL